MVDTQQQQQQNQQQNQSSARMALRNAGVGEIVEVQGGHIVRSTGRKDRHSKVCTAKGPRDRRVRLSAHTAIKFYDVQDRLGYDRPSKAVDWLIKNAKPAIDELEQLPPWQPTSTNPPPAHQVFDHGKQPEADAQNQQQQQQQGSGKKPVEAAEYGFQQHLGNPAGGNASFLPPPLDSDAIADSLKSFFPVASSSSSSSIHFQSCQPDLLSRTSSQNQDLRLSLQSFQDPLLLQHQHHHHHHHHSTPSGEQALFTGSTPMAFDVSAASVGWSEHQEMGRFQRMLAWNTAESSGGGGGYIFAAPQPMPLLAQNPFFSQRGPLQSSNSPAIRAWADPTPMASDEHQLHQPSASSIPPVGFASGGFSGFRIPARIQGDEEQDAVVNKRSSVSSAPRH